MRDKELKSLKRLLAAASLTALVGCSTLSGSGSEDDGYDTVDTDKNGNVTTKTLRNGCIVTETITQEPNLYRFQGDMKCPWDKDGGPGTP